MSGPPGPSRLPSSTSPTRPNLPLISTSREEAERFFAQLEASSDRKTSGPSDRKPFLSNNSQNRVSQSFNQKSQASVIKPRPDHLFTGSASLKPNKGKQKEVIDLTLSDTDDEVIIPLDSNMKPIVKMEKSRVSDRRESLASDHAGSSRFPEAENSQHRIKLPETQLGPTTSRKSPHSITYNTNANGLSPQEAIDMRSPPWNPPTISHVPLQLLGDGNSMVGRTKRAFSRTPSGSIPMSFSPQKKRKIMPPQSEKHRMSKAEWDAAIDEKKRLDDAKKAMLISSQRANGERGISMSRSVSKESVKTASKSKAHLPSPLKTPMTLPSTTTSPSKNPSPDSHLGTHPPSRATYPLSKPTEPLGSTSLTAVNFPSGSSNVPKSTPNLFEPSKNYNTSSQAGPSKILAPISNKPRQVTSTKSQSSSSQPMPKQPDGHVRTSSRPRPAPGAYTIPAADTPMDEWPRIDSTHSAGSSGTRRISGGSPIKLKNNQTEQRKSTVARSTKKDLPKVFPAKSTDATPDISRKSHSINKQSQISPTKLKSSNKRTPRTPGRDDNSSRRSTSSQLTPLPSRTASPANPSPVKSLSASPVKGRPFPRLLGDETPLPKDRAPVVISESKETHQEEEADIKPLIDPDAIFAEFDDFKWTNDEEEPINHPGVSGTAAETVDQDIITQTDSADSKPIQTDKVGEMSTPSETLTTPRSAPEIKSASPPPVSPNKRDTEPDKWQQLLEERKAEEEQEKEAERERERRMEAEFQATMGDKQDEGEGGASGESGDLTTFLDDINSKPNEPTKLRSPSPIKPDFKSAVQSRSESNKAKKEYEKAAKRKAKLDAIHKAIQDENARKYKNENKEFAKILKGIDQSNEFDEVMNDILASNINANLLKDRKTVENAYPTPETDLDVAGQRSGNTDDESEEDYYIDPENLDRVLDDSFSQRHINDPAKLENMIHDLKTKGVGVDDNLVRDIKVGLKQQSLAESELSWEGFWEDDHPKPEQLNQRQFIPFDPSSTVQDPILRVIIDMTSQSDSPLDLEAVSTVVSSGTLQFVKEKRREIGLMLLNNAISSSDISWSYTARSAFIDLSQIQGYFQTADLYDFVEIGIATLLTLGARKTILGPVIKKTPIVEAESRSSGLSIIRETGCALICRIIIALTKSSSSKVETQSILNWLPILLLLSVDSSTSSTLNRIIGDTIQILLLNSFDSSDDVFEQSRKIALSIASSSTTYPVVVKVAILESLGQRTNESSMVHKWLGMEFLSPGSLDQTEDKPSVPPVRYLLSSIQSLSDEIRPMLSADNTDKEEPNYDHINNRVTFLYAAMSDMAGLVKEMNIDFEDNIDNVKELIENCEVERVREGLRKCRDLLSDQSNGTLKAVVKARLHQLYEITRLTLTLEIKKNIRSNRLGKNLKVGSKGQTQLNFGKIIQNVEAESQVGIEMERKNSINGEGEDVEMLLG
ncbi:uncharacterized protein I206_106529 [Kwoniella pini CBS 10737]|uniref:Uncharacterized protein n=1 Tax=Kwoniella pini CBS 10737 TaxID=1296096 RepID=A0A1B9HS82_9TREE|nr:uncharacterized protein I206_07917 [Kwoniella pini CBS 10737]OCF46132.1 hypothetical protein I206_07917 [Kwoniella pini CBS 10737]